MHRLYWDKFGSGQTYLPVFSIVVVKVLVIFRGGVLEDCHHPRGIIVLYWSYWTQAGLCAIVRCLCEYHCKSRGGGKKTILARGIGGTL